MQMIVNRRIKISNDQLFFVLSIAISLIYFSIWAYIDILQYYTFNLHIWDVGVNFFLPYETSLGHFHNSIEFAVRPFQPQKLVYFLVVPIVLVFPYPISLVIFQIFLVAVSGNFVFLTARKLLNNNVESILLSTAYLFNFALFGVSFFPSHYSDFFPTFFIIAVYFQLISRKRLSVLFLILAAMSSYLAAITSILYVLILMRNDLVSIIKCRSLGSLRSAFQKNGNIIFSVLVIITLFTFSFEYYGFFAVSSTGHLRTSGNILADLSHSFLSNLQLKIIYITLVLIPFGGVIYKSKYSTLLIPYFVLISLSPFANYEYFVFQYTFLIGTLLFLSFADGLKESGTDLSKRKRIRLKRFLPVSERVLALVIVVFLLDMVILPFGPLNQYAGSQQGNTPFWDFNIHSLTTVTTQDRDVLRLINLIPLNASVLMQETMPQLTNHQLWFEPGMYNFSPLVQYVVADPFSWSFAFIPPNFIGPFPYSMEYLFNKLYQTKNYGLYASLDGNILLKKDYKGSPLLFSPYNMILNYDAFFNESGYTPSTNLGYIEINNETNGHFAFSSQLHFSLLPPGTYKVTFDLSTSNNRHSNVVTAAVISSSPQMTLSSITITGKNFTSVDQVTPISFVFAVNQYYTSVYFSLYYTSWLGTLKLYQVSLNETAP